MHLKPFLVEIRLKDWISDLPNKQRTVCYEEVLATDDIHARFVGFDQFEARSKHTPVLKRKLFQHNITAADCCASDAVEIDS